MFKFIRSQIGESGMNPRIDDSVVDFFEREFCVAMASDNPKFDKDKFKEASGLTHV
jgi:hypothetical protein